MKYILALLLYATTLINTTYAQHYINKRNFFSDTSIVNITIALNLEKLLSKRDKEGYIFPATYLCRMGDSVNVTDQISVIIRGHFRRAYCTLPPLGLIYANNKQNAFYHLKYLKLVGTCGPSDQFDQYILREFACYKIYNLLTENSFRARLVNLNLIDSLGKKKVASQHAFLLEDIKELAKRNGDKVFKGAKIGNEAVNRRQMLMVAIFEYLIGNTDWSVPGNHNIRLIKSEDDLAARPLAVPYDFDGCGLVNTGYIAPDERMGIESVRERTYRGLACTPEDLNDVLEIFRKQKASIYATINNFGLLNAKSKKYMSGYLDEFFAAIRRPSGAEKIFINGAHGQ